MCCVSVYDVGFDYGPLALTPRRGAASCEGTGLAVGLSQKFQKYKSGQQVGCSCLVSCYFVVSCLQDPD